MAKAEAKKTKKSEPAAETSAPSSPKASGNQPTVGRIIHYHLSEQDASLVNQMRETQAMVGNAATAGTVLPLIVTAAHSSEGVNGQVLCDGDDSIWVTSAHEGTQPGQWSWPQDWSVVV